MFIVNLTTLASYFYSHSTDFADSFNLRISAVDSVNQGSYNFGNPTFSYEEYERTFFVTTKRSRWEKGYGGGVAGSNP